MLRRVIDPWRSANWATHGYAASTILNKRNMIRVLECKHGLFSYLILVVFVFLILLPLSVICFENVEHKYVN